MTKLNFWKRQTRETDHHLRSKKRQATQKCQECTTFLHVSRKGICGFNIIHSYDCINARGAVYCAECEKLRFIYSKNKLNHNKCMLLAKSISSFEYSCGAFLFSSDTKSKTVGTLCIRPTLHYAMQIEVPYYGSNVTRADKCSHCGENNAAVSQGLKQKFKNVLPMCKPCIDNRKEPLTYRPYGKGQKWFFFVCKCNFINGDVTPNHFNIFH